MTLSELELFDPHSRALSAGERRFACPLCGEGKPRDGAHRCLSLNAGSGAWFCHRCGEKGVLGERAGAKAPRLGAVRRAFALPPLPAEGRRSGGEGEQKPVLEDSPLPLGSSAPPLAFDPFAAWEDSPLVEGTAGAAYLEGRGLDGATCARAGVRFCARWWGGAAVLFPVFDGWPRREPKLVAVQGRYLNAGSGPKMRTGGRKIEGVFASHPDGWERVRRGAPLIVCEAPIDALSLARCGFPALALCGKDGAPAWLPIRCAFENVALAFDADEAGDQGAAKLAPVLSALGAKPFRLRPEGAKDWNAMLAQLGESAMSDWLAEQLLT